MKKLTRKNVQALNAVGDGVDVFSPMLARTLRDLERIKPPLLTICRPMNQHDGAGVMPFFGARLTAAGKELVAAADAKKGRP